ncbi:50S ribosomal protein L25 [Neobacillus vireti]|uniref:Large ribosomal subunit protein bL25 n=1 Tax=Neobacillus vireti LMG 21834 TaxID=1131730 RepID=A0AB94ISC6_9BACI|nr:50S ribosomal protein L25 [Neobacillus vireti]ETI69877.1 50S ribosomal protein L25 [Neobacillus vireti LMG 21834]KLT18177.1 50S ribosomal protein L25/general stress protein Ctc [Neobacillus vireti]
MNTLVAQERKDFKKGSLRKLKNSGEIPAVVYGREINTKSISIKNADLLKVIKAVGRNGIMTLNLDGKSTNVILRDYQNDPVKKEILHIDFLQVNQHTEIDTKVSVILKGTSNGEKAGGIVKQLLHELNITAKANDIPDNIEIDITDFEIGRTVRVADLKKDYNNFTINNENEETIIMIDYVKNTEEEEDISAVEV